MAQDPEDKSGKLNNNEYSNARRDILERAQSSLKKLSGLIDVEEIDRELERQSEEKEKAAEGVRDPGKLREHREEKLTAYKARTALQGYEARTVRESFIHRTWRLVKGLKALREEHRSQPELPAEVIRGDCLALVWDCWSPVCNGWTDMVDTGWNFLSRFGRDGIDAMLWLADLIIAAAFYIHGGLLWLWDKLWDLRFWFDQNKGWVFQIFAGSVSIVALLAIFISSLIGYEYSYYGKVLGITRNQKDVYEVINDLDLSRKMSDATGANISFDVERDIQFKKVYGFNLNIDSNDEIFDHLYYMRDIQVRAYAVVVDGEELVILEREELAQGLLTRILKDFTPPNMDVEYTDVHFEENVMVTEVGVQLGDLWNYEDARVYLETGYLSSGEAAQEAKVHVVSTELSKSYERINYGTRYIQNASLYADETELVSEGVYGRREIVSQVERVNGEESSRTIISSVQISDPVDEVMYKGTKPIPARTGSGTFIYPMTSYTISSRFGMRWGRMHQGVDFAGPQGTKIYASDGGTVTYAGWMSGYGYVVMIDHGGFFETRYAHCSKLLVSVGDKVYQGQNIALVGSTGNSSGPHCHFEVRYKGEPMNPLNYL